MRSARSQSAMEYLMTYGWAILIIAVVLGALYSLGVFNAVNFMPKVPGGGCHVFRPNGPGTSWNVNLVGSCNNALPQYVAQFNGQSSYINVGTSLITSNEVSFVIWAERIGNGNSAPRGIMFGQAASYLDTCTGSNPSFYLDNANSVQVGATGTGGCPPVGQWVQYAGTYNGATMKMYINGVAGTPASQTGSLQLGTVKIGGYPYSQTGYNFNGVIANVQIYDTSLTANQVAYLYNEGIGGVPISPQYLVGWWPLNGDANDYSGNNNNGVPTNVIFNGTWTNGYNVP